MKPLRLGPEVVTTPHELGALVVRDARADGQVTGLGRPSGWLMHQGLERGQLVGLCAALLTLPEPKVLVEAASLVSLLEEPALGALLLRALEAHDLGVLLCSLPDGRAVEDVLLEAAASVPLAGEPRRDLLTRLGFAGRTDLQAQVMLRDAAPEDLAAALPGLLVELPDLSRELQAALGALGEGDGAAARAVRAAFADRVAPTRG